MKDQTSLQGKWELLGSAAFLGAFLLLVAALALACAPTSDAALTAAVKTKMAADTGVPAMRIEVDTKNRVVTLTGNLDSQAQKDLAIQIARNTNGVVDVVDMIAVRTSAETGDAPDPSRTLGERIDDASITMAVKDKLLDDPQVKGLRIDVDTRDGIVYLTGIVRTSAEKSRAVQLARETQHVRDVQENITVSG
jgi:osmotically-inducible protein OsmY